MEDQQNDVKATQVTTVFTRKFQESWSTEVSFGILRSLSFVLDLDLRTVSVNIHELSYELKTPDEITSSRKSSKPSLGMDTLGKYPWIAVLNTFWFSFFLRVTKARRALDIKRGSLVDTDFSMCFTCSFMSEKKKLQILVNSNIIPGSTSVFFISICINRGYNHREKCQTKSVPKEWPTFEPIYYVILLLEVHQQRSRKHWLYFYIHTIQ